MLVRLIHSAWPLEDQLTHHQLRRRSTGPTGRPRPARTVSSRTGPWPMRSRSSESRCRPPSTGRSRRCCDLRLLALRPSRHHTRKQHEQRTLADEPGSRPGRIAEAARRSGRNRPRSRWSPSPSGTRPIWSAPLVDLGARDLGENYPQELWQKAEALADLPVRWHLIGHLKATRRGRRCRWSG